LPVSATSARSSAGGGSMGGKISCRLCSSNTRSIVADRFTSKWKRSATCCDYGAPSVAPSAYRPQYKPAAESSTVKKIRGLDPGLVYRSCIRPRARRRRSAPATTAPAGSVTVPQQRRRTRCLSRAEPVAAVSIAGLASGRQTSCSGGRRPRSSEERDD
jgi:hypothetical protein